MALPLNCFNTFLAVSSWYQKDFTRVKDERQIRVSKDSVNRISWLKRASS